MQGVSASQSPACHGGAVYVLALAIACATLGPNTQLLIVLQVTVVQKDCARCHATRSADEFYRDKHASDGLQARPTWFCGLCI